MTSPTSSVSAEPTSPSTPTSSPTPAHGTFTLTGSTQEPRIAHAAAILLDGRVLIVGGDSLAAEIYDPSTGTFTTTGSLSHDRTQPAAITLHDGRVLVVGAADNVDAKDTGAELYDPATGKFTPVRALVDRYGAAVALLQDGRVLVAGGSDVRSGNYSLSAELYDPASGKFTLTGSMKGARVGATATVLADGRVLIAGGGAGGDPQSGTAITLATAEIYDPASGRFSPAGDMTAPREDHAATALSDGRVLLTGGFSYEGGSYLSSAEIFDPKTDAFTVTGSMTTPRGDHVAVLLPDGKVLVAGGINDDNPVDGVATAELFDPTTGTFSATGSMHSPRQAFTATLLADGEVLIVGGTGYETSCELYRP
jgi:hypothetical protein